MSYYIVRHYQRGGNRVIKRGLSLEDAQRHCEDPETSSATAKRPENVRRTKLRGPWFDGYSEAR